MRGVYHATITIHARKKLVQERQFLKHVKLSFKIKQDKAELWKQKVTVTSVAVATTKFLFSMCDRTFDSDVGKDNFSLDILLIFVIFRDFLRNLGFIYSLRISANFLRLSRFL